MAKILRKSCGNHKAQFPKLRVFAGQKSILRHYCIQNVTDGTQIRAHTINKESVTHCSQFISVKAKKIVRKSEAQFQEKLRELRLRKNDSFLTKTHVCKKE